MSTNGIPSPTEHAQVIATGSSITEPVVVGHIVVVELDVEPRRERRSVSTVPAAKRSAWSARGVLGRGARVRQKHSHSKDRDAGRIPR